MDIVDTATIAAIGEIQSIAARHRLAVSIVTGDDVLGFLGVGVVARTDDVRDRVRASWEWRHYGEGWADWFGDLTLPPSVGAVDECRDDEEVARLIAKECPDDIADDDEWVFVARHGEDEYQARATILQQAEDERADDQARWELDR